MIPITKIRKFKIAIDRRETATGIGIVEYSRKETYYIASLYFDRKLTNKEAFQTAVEHVLAKQKPGERFIIRVTNTRAKYRPNWYRKYFDDYNVWFKFEPSWLSGFIEPFQLADDAIMRKTTITERLDDKGA